MKISITVPSLAELFQNSCELKLSPKGTSWSASGIGKWEKEKGVYLIYQGGFDIDAASEILSLTNNIYDTFTKANFYAKRHYLSMFIERIEVKEKKVSKVTYTPLFQSLIEAQTVRIRHDLLPREDSNLQPSSYRSPSVTKRSGLSHVRCTSDSGI